MPERQPRGHAEGVSVFPEVGLKLLIRGIDGGHEVVREELELLAQPPPHDRVVAIEAHRQRLAVVDLLPDVISVGGRCQVRVKISVSCATRAVETTMRPVGASSESPTMPNSRNSPRPKTRK
jgi:hypothetical protein